MENPVQVSHFTKMPNDLFEFILQANLSHRELKIILAIIRFTHGFHCGKAELSLRYIAKAVRIKFPHVSSILRNLASKNVLTISDNKDYNMGRIIILNNDYTSWNLKSKSSKATNHRLPVDSSQNSNSGQNSNYIVPKTVTV